MYQKVLIPLDGSELAECALDHAKHLADHGSLKEIIVLNVVEFDSTKWDELKGIDAKLVKKTFVGLSKKYLANVKSRIGVKALNVKTVVLTDLKPAQAIINYAQDEDVDLIIIATHGYTGMKKLLLGSVAYRVLHESPVPIILIRPESSKIEG